MTHFEIKRNEIKLAEIHLGKLRRDLKEMVDGCPHHDDPSFWIITYTPECHKGYTDPGDPPGTMGVDRRLPCYVPPITIDKWTRTCHHCGTVETTTRVEEIPVTKKTPKW